MNKSDKMLIIISFSVAMMMICIFLIFEKKGQQALVYHGNTLIKTIDLSKDAIYQVEGDLGIIDIEVRDYQIRVIQENSPYHLCSRQGYISSSNETIICMPNKIIIEIVGENSIDTQVK